MFNDDQSDNSNTPLSPEDTLKAILNEDGKQKYDSVDKALAALQHSQDFIPQLKTEKSKIEKELAELKLELEKRSSVEDIVTRLQNKDTPTDPQDTPSVSGLDEASIEALITQRLESTLSANSAKALAEGNKGKVVKALQEQFGTEAGATFNKIAEEAGMSVKELEELSAKSPSLVLKLAPQRQPNVDITKGSTNSYVFNQPPKGDGVPTAPEVSVLSGASTKDVAAEMRKHKEYIYKKYNVTTN